MKNGTIFRSSLAPLAVSRAVGAMSKFVFAECDLTEVH